MGGAKAPVKPRCLPTRTGNRGGKNQLNSSWFGAIGSASDPNQFGFNGCSEEPVLMASF